MSICTSTNLRMRSIMLGWLAKCGLGRAVAVPTCTYGMEMQECCMLDRGFSWIHNTNLKS